MLAIKLMRTGAKKRPSYRVIVKEKQSKRDGAYLENLGTYNPTREPAEIKLDMDRVRYWMGKGAKLCQPGCAIPPNGIEASVCKQVIEAPKIPRNAGALRRQGG